MDRFSNILKQQLEARQSDQAAHPSSDALVAFVEQGLSGSQRENVLAHLSVCPECREAVALATPESSAVQAEATQAVRAGLYFPAAIRWASLAAALAVAVGVGLIAYEHESPIQREAKLSVPQEQTHTPAVSPAPAAKIETATNAEQSSTTRTSGHSELQSSVTAKRIRPERIVSKKASTDTEVALNKRSSPLPNAPNKEKYQFRLSAAPSQTQAAVSDKQDAAPAAPVLAPSQGSASQVVSVTAQDQTIQEANGSAVATKPSPSVYGGIVGGSATLVEPTPAKTLNAVSVSGSAAKAKQMSAVRGFVRWTISAAGKLERLAKDGTMSIVEPVPGAIIRAVAAEGIEVWAGGSQSSPSPQNARPRSLLFHSSDAGETWKTIDGPWQGSITKVNLAGLGTLTVVTTDGSWTSGDSGKSWSKP